eukprot:3845169-Ditylum_brightwellii.AAC.1
MLKLINSTSKTTSSPRHVCDSRSGCRLWRCGSITCIEEASGSTEPSGRSMYVVAPRCTDYRSGCHPGEGKKGASESVHC